MHNPWSLPSARPSPTSSHILVTNANGRLPTARPELLLAAAISPQLLTECPKPGDEEFAESVFARALGCRLQAASTTWNLIAFLIKELMRVVWKSYDLYLLSPVSSCGHEGDGDNVGHCQHNSGGREEVARCHDSVPLSPADALRYPDNN